MKIALLGNMNNNNFAIMRYFRDLGADAHLLLWSNDGQGCLAHFVPENDTWEMARWAPFVHQTEIADNMISLIGDPRKLQLPISIHRLRKQLSGYDAYIGSGYAPAILGRIGMRLDIFYPYGIGIENVGDQGTRNSLQSRPFFRKQVLRYVRSRQIAGIRNSRHCINAEMSLTRQTFEEIGQPFLPLSIPMVYNRETLSDSPHSGLLTEVETMVRAHEISILSHCRQMWVRDPTFSAEQWEKRSKHNDWLIRGFARFIQGQDRGKAVLLMVEYGQDIPASKKLIADLGIGSQVRWLPKISRKEILRLLRICHIGVGEFGIENGLLWGGTAWEVMASGKPLFQTINFTPEEYQSTFGHELPPILDVKSPEDVLRHLEDFVRDPQKYDAMGVQSRDWFETHNGIGLAKKWLDLLHEQ